MPYDSKINTLIKLINFLLNMSDSNICWPEKLPKYTSYGYSELSICKSTNRPELLPVKSLIENSNEFPIKVSMNKKKKIYNYTILHKTFFPNSFQLIHAEYHLKYQTDGKILKNKRPVCIR